MEYTDNRDRLATVGVLGLGVVVAVVAVIALQNPGRSAGDGGGPAANVLRPHSTSSSHPAPHSSSRPAESRSATPSSKPSSTPSASSSSSGSAPSPKSIQLVVMNDTSTTGLAAGAMARFQAAGWYVSHIGTMQNNIVSTCAYYDPTVRGAQQAAEALQAEFPDIKRVEPRFPELYPGPVVVVLTWDYKPA